MNQFSREKTHFIVDV